MSKKSSDETKDQRDNSLDWTYWNQIPVLELEQAILLTVNWTPRATRKFLDVCDYSAFYPPRYHEILAIAEAHILNGSLNCISQFQKNVRAVDWLAWLLTIDISAPDEWQPIGSECSVERRSAEGRMVEVEDLPATTAGSILFYPIADGKQWVIGRSGSEKKIDKLAAFEEMALAFRSPGVDVLESIAPNAFTPTFGEEKVMDGKMADELSRETSDLTESIRIARKEGNHGELEKYQADLDRLNQFSPDSRECLNKGDPMKTLTSSIRSRRKTAIRKIHDEFGDEFAALFEAYKVGNRYVTYQPNEPEPTWILDPPTS